MANYEPLTSRFGARVTGLDLSGSLDDRTFADLRDAFAEYSVLYFPDQPLTNEQQIAFSRRLGPLEATKVGSYGAGTPLVILSNIGEDGKIVPDDHQLNMVHRANGLWHSDSSFKPVPALASFLTAKTVPPEGGETEYASMVVAWDDLPRKTKAKIDGKVAIHHFATSRNRIDPDMVTNAEHDELPPVRQIMVRKIPETGKRALYVGSHTRGIEGVQNEEARTLIDELVDFATRSDKVYTHKWRENDAVLWDNRAVIHRGLPFARSKHARVMIRTTVAGDGPTALT